MYKKYLNCYNVLITGLLTLTLGILTLTLNQKFIVLIIYLVASLLMIYAISNIIKLITKKDTNQKMQGMIMQIMLNITISCIFFLAPKIPLSLFTLIFGLYAILNSVIKLVNYLIFKINHLKGRFIELLVFAFYLFFGIFCICIHSTNLKAILLIIGLYFILLGATYISDFITQIIPKKQKNNFKRKFKITLPLFMSVLIPHDALNQINKNKDMKTYTPQKIFKETDEEKPDLEILIHVTKKGFGITGHADICFENKVYTYGNYNHNSFRLFNSIGDGVLVIARDKEKYIKFCIKDCKKTIFVFGIKLTDKQKMIVKDKLNELKKNTYVWDDAYKNTEYMSHNYYATRLYKDVKSSFYKFKNGKFKTYFVCSTNCVSLVDYVLGATGTNIIRLNGIITPGAYYDYLATEYTKKNSNVISYKIYK